ncbi:MAG TPA: hypothetical protein GX690_01165 [Tenericutes bacterium]|nr:hypothetical protein [Mycoplasmatota bacterium]
MQTYEINRNTQAIIAHQKNNKLGSLVYEKGNKFFVPMTPTEIIKKSCEYFGSSFEGRQKGTKSLLCISHKVPIVVEELNQIIFFPTTSPRLEECSWISLSHIEEYEKSGYDSKVYFKEGESIELPISIGVLDNQVLRAARLVFVLRKRKEKV